MNLINSFRILHLGGERCVTGSCRLVQIRGHNILVDCGMVQGRDASVPIERWPVKPAEVDFIFLTHAHVDHIGLLPTLIQQGFKGEIIGSHPTIALILPMLEDAMRFEALRASEREKNAQQIEDLSWGFEYGEAFDLQNDVVFELGRAGHILGSCFIRLEDQKNGSAIIFSGDLGNHDTPILNDPESAGRADVLFLESTYGDRLHDDRAHRMEAAGQSPRSLPVRRRQGFHPGFFAGSHPGNPLRARPDIFEQGISTPVPTAGIRSPSARFRRFAAGT